MLFWKYFIFLKIQFRIMVYCNRSAYINSLILERKLPHYHMPGWRFIFFKKDKIIVMVKRKLESNKKLAGWIRSIINFLEKWNLKENPVDIMENWLSILQYLITNYGWVDNLFYHTCSHGPFSAEEELIKMKVPKNLPASIQPAFTCSKLTIETLEQPAKYVQS